MLPTVHHSRRHEPGATLLLPLSSRGAACHPPAGVQAGAVPWAPQAGLCARALHRAQWRLYINEMALY